MSSFDEVFAAVKEYCKERLVLATYNLFIDGIEPVSFEGSVATLSVRSDFVKGIVETRYKDLLREAFKELLGFDIDVELTIPAPVEQAPAEVPGGGNYEFTFENFIVGSTNKFAHAAAQAVAANPSGAYNPLFIWGGSGLGKTHLLGAIQFEIHKNFPDYNIVYVDGEKFTNEIISAIHDNTTAEFHNKYRAADVLLVDDIQFISSRERTQEEFFNTFNALHTAGKQIILSSDRPPMELTTLEERLRSRFEGGLITDVQPPDLETRIAILKKKATDEGIDVDESVLSYIAEKVNSNIRQLEGSLTRVYAYAKLTKRPLDSHLADAALKDIIPGYENRKVTVELIQQVVADYYSVDVESLLSQRRTMEITYPRQVAMYLSKELTEESLKAIGRRFGGRDHTTVINACKKIKSDMDENPQLVLVIEDLTKRIRKN